MFSRVRLVCSHSYLNKNYLLAFFLLALEEPLPLVVPSPQNINKLGDKVGEAAQESVKRHVLLWFVIFLVVSNAILLTH